MSREIIAVIPAAGVGSRMQANKPKQYLKILDKTILEHTLSVILSHPAINHVILAVGKNDPYLSEMTLFPHQNITLVEGGETRAESVLNGLKAIKNDHAWVLVHDAARPCLTHQDLDKLLQTNDEQGAILAIPAAGVGSRMQANKPKQYLKILDKTILEHTLSIILSHPAINHVILAVGKNDPYLSEITLFPHQNITLVEGGETRAESVLNGLDAIKNNQAWVLVHDAARPCLTHQDLDKLLQIDDEQGGILAIPAVDTIKRANKQQNIIKTEDRTELWLAQTPQFFRCDLLRNALKQGLSQGANITDEASAMELAGFQPHLVVGRSDNIKVTRPEDLALAEFYLTRKTL